MPINYSGGIGLGAIRDWSPTEIHAWRRVESTWAVLYAPSVELKSSNDTDWEYGPEATEFLDALEQFFEQIGPRIQTSNLEWNKRAFTQCLADFGNNVRPGRTSLWDSITFLRAATRVSRFPDNNDGGWFADYFAAGWIRIAMARLGYLTAPSIEDVKRILAFKPTFDSLSVQDFRHWLGGDKIELEDGREAIHVPWPQYHPVVQEWSEAVYHSIFYIDPYHGIKDGEPIPDPKFLNIGEKDDPNPADFFAALSLGTVRQYMAVCIRGEKWCDGHIASEFERGVIQAAFDRLWLLVN